MKWNLIIPYLWSHCQKKSCEFFEFLTRMLRLQMIENSPEPRRIRKAKRATRTYSSESNSDISPMLFLHNSLRNWDVASWHLMFQVDSLLHLKKLILSVEKLNVASWHLMFQFVYNLGVSAMCWKTMRWQYGFRFLYLKGKICIWQWQSNHIYTKLEFLYVKKQMIRKLFTTIAEYFPQLLH